MAAQQLITMKLKNVGTGIITDHRVLATMVGDFAIHRVAIEYTKAGGVVFGSSWTITAPNGYGLGWFATKKNAMACANDLKEFTTAAALVVISQKKEKKRTVEEVATVNMVKHIVEQYMPIEEGNE